MHLLHKDYHADARIPGFLMIFQKTESTDQCPFLPRLYHTESTVCTGSDHDSFISAFTRLQCPAMQSNIYKLLYRIPCLCTELSILYLHIFILFCRTFQQEGIACLEDRTGTGIVSSKSQISKTSLPSGETKISKLAIFASPHACTRIPAVPASARSLTIMTSAPPEESKWRCTHSFMP